MFETSLRITAASAALLASALLSSGRAANVDCGPSPTLDCISTHVFALAKSLPAQDYTRAKAHFAETQLAPANRAVAMAYFVDDNQHPMEWERVDWLARAGAFDKATAEARQADSPEIRIGGLLAVAWQLAKAKAADRAAKLLTEVDPLLPAVADNEYPYAANAAQIWAQIGRFDQVARLLSDAQAGSVMVLFEIAAKYPAKAADLRRQGWALAERVDDHVTWWLIAKDAASRGDAQATARAAERALARGREEDTHRRVQAIDALLRVNLRDQANSALASWPNWTANRRESDLPNLIAAVTPLLIELGRESEIEPAASRIVRVLSQSQAYGRAAELLFRKGQTDKATEFEAKAIAVAEEAPYDDKQSQFQRDGAFNNLALARSRRGDIAGAIEMTQQVGDGTKMREVLSAVIRTALDAGHGVAVLPAIDRLATMARANGDANLVIQAGSFANSASQKDKARSMLAEALVLRRNTTMSLFPAAELMWRLDGKLDNAVALIGTAGTETERSNLFRHLANQIASTSPADALKIASRISDPATQLEALSQIAEALLAADKPKPN